jgi:hypothetical protein
MVDRLFQPCEDAGHPMEDPRMTWRHKPERPGATAYGSHYWAEWDACPRKWWLAKRAPHPSGEGSGLTPFGTDRNLLIGRLFHEAIASYYLTDWKGGDYHLDAALTHAIEEATSYRADWNDDSGFEDDCLLVRRMLTDYHAAVGPHSPSPDFPNFRVAADTEGNPLIERDFSMPLGDGTAYTVRVDGIVEYAGSLYALEHKTTSSAYFGKDLRASLHLALQVAGQCMVLNHPSAIEVTGRPVSGAVVNLIPKRRTKTDPPYMRDTVTYTRLQLGKVEADIRQRQRIQDLLNTEYDHLVDGGTDPYEAGALVFPATGPQTGTCFKYNRFCEYYGVCRAVGLEAQVATGYRISTPNPTDTEE